MGKKFPDNSSDAYLLLTFDGNSSEQLEKDYEKVANICLEEGALDAFIIDTDELIKYTHLLQEQFNVRIRCFGHAGDGNLHVYVLKDELSDEAWKEKLSEVFEAMYRKSRQLEGLVSGEHGIGYAKKGYMFEQYESEYLELMRNIKLAFDPKNILNPGKVCE